MLKNYNCNIDNLHNFLANELRDSIIIPVLTSNIAISSGDANYSNFAYSNFELNCNIDSSLESSMTKDLNKSKLFCVISLWTISIYILKCYDILL